MNPVLETIMNHRSIRHFKDIPLETNEIEAIVQAAQKASTSDSAQCYSIIGITDHSMKKELSILIGQSFIEQSGHLFIFCADLHRVTIMASEEQRKQMGKALECTVFYQTALIDTTIAAQNAALAAESLGLGICYLGSILDARQYLNTKLRLPERVIPLFGIVAGVPEEQPEPKPRLPLQAVYFENEYLQDQVNYRKLLQTYDEQMNQYYQTRTTNQKQQTWTESKIQVFSHPLIPEHAKEYSDFIQQKGFNKN